MITRFMACFQRVAIYQSETELRFNSVSVLHDYLLVDKMKGSFLHIVKNQLFNHLELGMGTCYGPW